jgi:hypothetical protein
VPTATPTPTPTNSPPPITTDYTLVAEGTPINQVNSELRYSLFVVRTDGTGKVLLDQGAKEPQSGRIVNGRVFFEQVAPFGVLNIYSINLDGTDRRQLTSGNDYHSIAAIVGDRIVVRRLVGQFNLDTNLDSMRLDGSDLRVLANDPKRGEEFAAASADGQRVLIHSNGKFPNGNIESDLYSLSVDGSSAPVAIADSPDDERFLALAENTVIFSARKIANGLMVKQVYARNLDGSGLTTLSNGSNGVHDYIGTVGGYAVIGDQSAGRVEAVKLDGSARQQLLEGLALNPGAQMYVQGTELFFERPDSLGVQQVHRFDIASALQGTNKPPAQLTHSVRDNSILYLAPSAMVVARYGTNPLSVSVYAVQLGPGGTQENLLVNDAGNLIVYFVHQGHFIFQRILEPTYSIKLDGTGLVKLLDQPGIFRQENVKVAKNNRLIVTRYTEKPNNSAELLAQVFAVNADGSNAMPLTALSPSAEWAGDRTPGQAKATSTKFKRKK